MSITFKMETITPKIAHAALDKNTKNRFLSDYMSKQYAEAMKDGEWHENGETIKFFKPDADGNEEIMDGQHRFAGIVLSGTTQKMLIVRGLEPHHMETIDIGKKRSNRDALEINGYKNKTVLAAAVSICLDWKGKEFHSTKKRKTPDRAVKYLKTNSSLDRIVKEHSNRIKNKTLTHMVSISVLSAIHHKLSAFDRVRAERFIHEFIEVETLAKNHPIYVLRKKLMLENRDIHMVKGDKFKRRVIAYFVMAFNAYIKNRKIEDLKYNVENPIIIGS